MTENKEEKGNRSNTIEILKVVVPVIGTVLVAAFALLQIVIPTILANQATQTAVAIQRTDTAEAIQRTQTAEANQATQTESAPPTNTQTPSYDTLTVCGATSNCDEPEDPEFSRYWNEFRKELGCQLPRNGNGNFVEQEFEDGYMIWVEQGEFHFAFVDDPDPEQKSNGRWYQRHKSELDINDINDRISQSCDSLHRSKTRDKGPISGFSALWCALKLYDQIGEAVESQTGHVDEENRFLKFKCGYMLRDRHDRDYILIRKSGDRYVEEGIYYVGR